MYMLENEVLKVAVAAKGAELQSIVNKAFGLEYLWDGNPAFWAKHSPILFPIVGTLKNNTYFCQGKQYQLSRHGFAREMDFEAEKSTPRDLILLLKSNEATKKNYPFDFELRVRYQLTGNELSTEYMITNTGSATMYFSIGGHPAFRVPLTTDTIFSDYYLRFEMRENLSRWPISPDGLIEQRTIPVLEDSNRLDLQKSLFYQDALVFKYPTSSEISIVSEKTPHGIQFEMGEFPFLGIWSAKDADFLCIEPWCGIADSVDTIQKLEHKEGIEKALPGQPFSRQWRVKVF